MYHQIIAHVRAKNIIHLINIMNITLLQLLTFIIAVSIFILTPGPGVFATIAKAMSDGVWAVLPFAIGLAAGDTIYMVLSAYGLSALATNYHSVFLMIKYIGAMYLFYLAWKMWVTLPSMDMLTNQAEKSSAITNIISGFLISASNPKVILFYVSLLPSFFPVANLTTLDIIVVCAVIFVVAVIMMLAYAFMANYAQKQLKTPKARQNFNRVGAFFMGLAGTWLLAKK